MKFRGVRSREGVWSYASHPSQTAQRMGHPAVTLMSGVRLMRDRSTSKFYRVALLFLSLTVASAQAETFLHLVGETLSGRQMVLPDNAHGRIALLVIGFTKKSSQATREWGQRFRKDFGSDQRYVVYQVAVLEDVPRFIRGMVTSSIRRETPPGEQEHFVTLFNGEANLKRFVAYSAPDDAYLLLFDAKGEIRWRGHGLFLEEDYAGLQETTKQLGSE